VTHPDRRFWFVLGGILVAALVVRVVFVQTVARHDDGFYDAFYYELQADANADGQWFQVPALSDLAPGPAADHPPLTALVLTPIAVVKRTGNQIFMRYATVLFGLGTVFVIGLLGREVGGVRVGWVAAAIAAVYPYLWVNDGLIMSESLAALLTVTAVLLAYRLARSRAVGVAVALGAVCGLAALTRAELVLLAPLFVLPIALRDRQSRPAIERWRPAGIVVGVTVAVLVPWIAWNTVRFDRPVLISTNEGIALAGSSCDEAFYGGGTGLTGLTCLSDPPAGVDQSVASAEYRVDAVRYISDNLGRYPAVLASRVGRTWSVFRPFDMLGFNEGEGRPRWVTALGLWFYYPLLLLAVGGVILMIRAARSVWPLVVPAIVVTLGVIPAFGQTRFRVPAEPSLVVLAAVALVWIVGRVGRVGRVGSAGAGRATLADPVSAEVT